MNIGIIRMRYTPYGGAEVFLSRLIEELIKRGHECDVFANEWKENERDGLVFHKAGIIRCPSFLRVLSFAINTYFALKKNPVDVIIGFDKTFHQDIYRAGDGCHREWLIQRNRSKVKSQKSKVKRTIKRITTLLNPLHITILYLEKRLLQSKRLKFVIANSRRGKDEIMRHYGLPEEKICVIYNGIDLRAFSLHEREEIRAVYREKLGIRNETILLFVGSGFERKGLRFLIEAMGVLKRDGCSGLKLIVIGKGSVNKYQDIAGGCGVARDVKFIGPVQDVHGYYSAADIFVLPSIYEPFSNACLEAMAAGLPVVTSRVNGVSEILSDGEDGMVIDDPADPVEVAEKIEPLLEERKRVEMGQAARIKVEGYPIERNVDEFLSLIEKGGLDG